MFSDVSKAKGGNVGKQAHPGVQVKQKTLGEVSPESSLLQRTCACGQHTLAGAECPACRNERRELRRSRKGIEPPSASTVPQGESPVLESTTSPAAINQRASHFNYDFSQVPPYPRQTVVPQTKLTINQPGDAYEQEADQTAEVVMHMTDLEASVDDEEQAKNAPTHNESKGSPVRAAAIPGVPPAVDTVVSNGEGQPLDTTTRAFVEPRFGHDFSQVRIHADKQAGESAQTLNALAYTVGQNVVFAPGQYQPATNTGQRLLAHELAHVLQQTGQPELRAASRLPMNLRSGVPNTIQAKDDAKSDPLADILPPGTNLQESKSLLLDLFGKDALDRVVAEIRGNEAAKKLVRNSGAPAVLALVDTRNPKGLDPAGAEKKLTTDKQLYERSRLAKRPEQAQEKSWLFQEKPPTQNKPAATGEESPIESAVGKSQEPFVEPTTFTIGTGMVVRFAHLRADWQGDKPSPQMGKARDLVIDAIRQVLQDLDSLPDAPNKQVRSEDEKTRARLKETVHAFSASRPLIIFLASELTLTSGELLGKEGLAFKTDQVYVSRDELGDPTKLQAAIRMQLIKLFGGTVGLGKPVSALTSQELKESVLHETIHAFLITKGISANQVWNTIKNQLVINGPPTVRQRCEELIHRFLLAQEEVFVYENVAKMGKDYQAFLSNKDVYDLYVGVVKVFFESRHAKFGESKQTLDAQGKSPKKSGSWTITLAYPKVLTVDATDMTHLNELVAKFPGT